MARSILLLTILVFSPSLLAETFSPKVVCFGENDTFLGWMNIADCSQQKGTVLSHLSTPKASQDSK